MVISVSDVPAPNPMAPRPAACVRTLAVALVGLGVLGAAVPLTPDALAHYGWDAWTSTYTVVVALYFLSRFLLAAVYRPPEEAGLEPTVSVIVPAYNEGVAVARTIHACMSLDYPGARLEIVCVNDGSTDDTWDHMRRAAAAHPGMSVRCIDLGRNQGKRAAMAAGVRATSGEVIVFVDSDSEPAPGAVRRLVQGFADPEVAAVSGLTYVRNADVNLLTRMQAVQYYVSFQLLKSAESVFGAVTCCSGCFAAYRRTAVLDVMGTWEHQSFLGLPRAHGDDRALTNMVLRRGWTARYDSRAEAWTDAPERYGEFLRQQLRWKKSWVLESPALLGHLWRTRPLAFPSALVGTLSGLVSPVVLLADAVWNPFIVSTLSAVYLVALCLIGPALAAMHGPPRSGVLWRYSIVTALFYAGFSLQLYWAVLRLRDGRWGTRRPGSPAPAGLRPRDAHADHFIPGPITL